MSRSYYLDSLRGLAACLVAITHFFGMFLPYAVFGNSVLYTQHFWWEHALLIPPLSLLTSAHFAVCLFFVLSGYVLSINSVGKPGRVTILAIAIAKRPVRLGGVLVISVIVGAFLMSSDLLFHNEVAALTGAELWLSQFWSLEYSTHQLLIDFITAGAGSEYNPPLWTLRIELIGSFLVFGLMIALNALPYTLRTLVLLTIYFLLHGKFYDAFVFGLLVADARANTNVSNIELRGRIAVVAGFMSLALASFPYYSSKLAIAEGESIFGDHGSSMLHVPMVAAQFLFILVLFTPVTHKWLNNRKLIWLGGISYSLYAFHFLILGSLSSIVFIQSQLYFSYGHSVLITGVITLVSVFCSAALINRWVDTPAISAASWLDRKLRQFVDGLLKRWRLQGKKTDESYRG